ncbi:MAG: lipopolysaccharide heptosyltransferase I [Phycisphaerales bacterium]
MDTPRRILIIRPSALGDVCRSVPLAAALKEKWPDASISWLVNAPYADAVSAHPAVDEVIPFDRKGMGATSRKLNPLPALRFMRELRCRRFDITIDAQGLLRSGLFTLATRARLRVGYADARELGWLGLNRKVNVPSHTHTVDRMLALLTPLGLSCDNPDMRLYSTQEAQNTIKGDSQLDAPFIVLAPTSLWPGKRWPIDRFAELAERIRTLGLNIVVIGAPGEENQCTPLIEMDGVIDRIGKTSVGEMMAIIERARLVVANDSAALHMAVGLQVPIVALFGPTDTALVGPYQQSGNVIQHRDPADVLDHKQESLGTKMMNRISVDEVWELLSMKISSAKADTQKETSPRNAEA